MLSDQDLEHFIVAIPELTARREGTDDWGRQRVVRSTKQDIAERIIKAFKESGFVVSHDIQH